MPLEGSLVEDFGEVGHEITLPNRRRLEGLNSQEEIAGEERFAKHDRLPAVLVGGIVARQRRGQALTLAMLREFLLAARAGMSDKPK